MKRLIWTAVLLTGLSSGAVLLAGAEEGKSLSDTVQKTVETQQQTQKKQEAWAEEKNDLGARYRAAKAQVDYLEKTRAFEENEVGELDKGIAELNRRMIESAKLKDNLEDSLNVVVSHLDNFIKQDIPFLMDERHARIASVREAIAKPEVSGAEKLRRVLEALQVEANYGNTVDVSQERIQVGSDEVSADVIRIGRVSVYWRSPDGKRVGEYDRASNQWVELDHKYAETISDVREMVLRLRSTKLITLPLGRIQP